MSGVRRCSDHMREFLDRIWSPGVMKSVGEADRVTGGE